MKDKIFQFVQSRGPVLSKDVSKHFGMNTTYAGAFLSELIQDKKLKYSHIKVGTSPLYYCPEQKEKLIMLFEHMNGKDKDSFSKLKERKVLRDNKLPTIDRVSLRSMKDFAFPLNVNIGGAKEIFWKWYLMSNEEASVIIKSILGVPPPQQQVQQQQVQQPIQQVGQQPGQMQSQQPNQVQPQQAGQPQAQQQVQPAQPSEDLTKQKEKLIQIKTLLDQEKKELENEKIRLQQKLIEEQIKIEEKVKKEVQEQIDSLNSLVQEQKSKIEDMKQTPSIDPNMQGKIDEQSARIQEQQSKIEELNQLKESKTEDNQELIAELKQEIEDLKSNKTALEDGEEVQEVLEPKNIEEEEDEFIKALQIYFKDKSIEIVDYNIIKKEAEIEFSIRVPSVIGLSDYYCRAKNKKKLNEGDLSTAYVIGQVKKLPVLFLSYGDLTKKAKSMLDKEFKNNLFFKQLE